ncbi:hypothetical protein ACG3SL_07265 [Sphingomonas sp. CJ20]
MQQSVARRYLNAAIFALLSGIAVAMWNPMDDVKASLRSDGHGLKTSLELAIHDITECDGQV